MTFRPVPKPIAATKEDKTVAKLVKAWGRQKRWRETAIQNAKGKPRTKVKERNEKRIARKAKALRQAYASPFHRQLRYLAYTRSKGFCECEVCVSWAFADVNSGPLADQAAITRSQTEIPVWFTNTGGEPWRRFRSTDGELHHRKYGRALREHPDAIDDVLWVWKSCHQRIESEFGTRRRFLKGR